MVWAVIATVASAIAAVAALTTVVQSNAAKQEARRQTLADAVLAIISASEKHPGPDHPETAEWDSRLAEAGRQLDRAAIHSILGFGPGNAISMAILELMDPKVRADPTDTFMYGTKALQEMIDRENAKHVSWPWRLLHPEADALPPPRESG